ncbi:hypothetical protein EDC30_1065 [Paucimonas lemoignei]|uniref:Uncharacterized protein n=1 Tax=Paucimonas lemoignei TaxID=29443 RepID=A0A4R3HTD3_PAULE|nr:hypothetical protein [Paucimonas lemoignei]TCS36466.1 hypothetical protein EDC30_1065 [Paucimonas lemoignei]
MSANQMARLAELENQAFSLMGRLHVVLRRETGRITDVEYMRIDPAYCRHLIQLAAQSGHIDLIKIAERLHDIYFGENGLFVAQPPKPPLLERLGNAVTASTAPAASVAPSASTGHAASRSFHGALSANPENTMPESAAPPGDDQHYVGRLR